MAALGAPARILCAADICDALRATRPYRPGLAVDRILEIMGREVGSAIDADCFEALREVLLDPSAMPSDAIAAVPEVQRVKGLAEDYQQAA
jgi:HD-GYP domain-containing protein (c-di-GMP phosphodiesterase class II)